MFLEVAQELRRAWSSWSRDPECLARQGAFQLLGEFWIGIDERRGFPGVDYSLQLIHEELEHLLHLTEVPQARPADGICQFG